MPPQGSRPELARDPGAPGQAHSGPRARVGLWHGCRCRRWPSLSSQLRPAVPLPTEPTGAVLQDSGQHSSPAGRGSSSLPPALGRGPGCRGRLAKLRAAHCVRPGPQG